MSETVFSVEDAAARLSEVVDAVHASREPAILTRSGLPVVRIVPIPPAEDSAELISFLRRWRIQYPEPDEQLSQAIEESRQTVGPPRNPWD
jgi:prevent-host-death family protein